MTFNDYRLDSEEAKNYHEECVLKVRNYIEERGYGVHRIGNFDISSNEEYNSKIPLPLRLSKLSADLLIMEHDKIKMYVEVKTEDCRDKQRNIRLNGLQMAYFIHQFNQKGIQIAYFYFQRDGLEKGWMVDDLNLLDTMEIYEGDTDVREYVDSAIQFLKERRKK